MSVIAQLFALVAGLIHVMIFVMESLLWSRPQVQQTFGVRSEQDAAVAQPWAFNQGFYNLFLAAGVLVGLTMVNSASDEQGTAIVVFACLSMLGAGLVLLTTGGRPFLRPALIQLVPPALAVLFTLV